VALADKTVASLPQAVEAAVARIAAGRPAEEFQLKESSMFKTSLHRLLLASVVLLLPAMAAHAEDPPLVRAQNAVRVLNEIMEAPDKSIPTDLLKQAKAIAVIPDLLKRQHRLPGRRLVHRRDPGVPHPARRG
jgi:hypothetical protein